jgi:hypothetical protein
MLAKIVDALKALAVVNHGFTCQPERIEGQGVIPTLQAQTIDCRPGL